MEHQATLSTSTKRPRSRQSAAPNEWPRRIAIALLTLALSLLIGLGAAELMAFLLRDGWHIAGRLGA